MRAHVNMRRVLPIPEGVDVTTLFVLRGRRVSLEETLVSLPFPENKYSTNRGGYRSNLIYKYFTL